MSRGEGGIYAMSWQSQGMRVGEVRGGTRTNQRPLKSSWEAGLKDFSWLHTLILLSWKNMSEEDIQE